MKNQSTFSLISVISLFFLWALAHNLNPVLIPHLKKACQLKDMESALVDSAFYIAYFFMALPAAWLIQWKGYRTAIVFGLSLFACGAFLFLPAANQLSYTLFLTALFILASGLTFLETAANPLIQLMGDVKNATQRLNFAQAFNGLGASIAAWVGSQFILSGHVINQEQLQNLSSQEVHLLLSNEASSVRMPYIIIGCLVSICALIFYFIPIPTFENSNENKSFSLQRILKIPMVKGAILAQFFYVGAQVGISSFFIRYCVKSAAFNEKEAALYLSIALFLFMSGRFVGSYLMRFIKAQRLMIIYCLINCILLLICMFQKGIIGVYALMLTEFFMSIQFPSIFSSALSHAKDDSKYVSSLMVMTIVGGAFMPLVMGFISDHSSIEWAYVMPLISFSIIFYVFYFNRKLTTK